MQEHLSRILSLPPRSVWLTPSTGGSYNGYLEGQLMSTVGVKELKNRLTHYLRRTKHGEEVIVTERGKPIALIQGIQSAEHIATREARLARLAAQGLVTLPARKLIKRIRPVKVSGPPVSRMIVEDRR
jgi:prevent-host-death family protein